MASRRQLILETMRTRLLAILVASNFNTNAGREVHLNEEVNLGPNDPEVAIAIIVNDDEVRFSVGDKLAVDLPIEIQALARADAAEPWIAVEQVIQDIKRAVELADRRLGGLLQKDMERGSTRTIARKGGSTTVGAAIAYPVQYAEAWGAP